MSIVGEETHTHRLAVLTPGALGPPVARVSTLTQGGVRERERPAEALPTPRSSSPQDAAVPQAVALCPDPAGAK